MAAPIDYYATLGVMPSSDQVVIRAAYKALMLKHHPDTNGGRDANERAAAINAAFVVLGDPARRAAYDASRERRSAPKPPPTPPPPPPPPPNSTPPPPMEPRPDNAALQPTRSRLLSRIGGTLVIVLVMGGVRIALSHPSSSVATDDNTMVVDVNATEGMETTAENITADDHVLDGGMMDNGSAPSTSGDMVSATHSLNLGPATALDFNNIEGATRTFERVIEKSGMLGARAYSEDCHKKVEAAPTWLAADRCAAFDYAAHYLDVGYAKASNTQTIGYFDFQAENQADQYLKLGGLVYQVNERLVRIQKTAEPATYEAVEAGIQRREARRTSHSVVPDQSTGATSPDNEQD